MTKDATDKDELKLLTKTSIQRIKECLNLLNYSEGLVRRDIDLVRIQLELKLKKLESRVRAELKDLVQTEKDRLENIADQIAEIMNRSESINENISQNDYRDAIQHIKKAVLVASADICRKRIKFDVCETLDKTFDEMKTLGRCTFRIVKEENSINEHIQQCHVTESPSGFEYSKNKLSNHPNTNTLEMEMVTHADILVANNGGKIEHMKTIDNIERDYLSNLERVLEKGTSNDIGSTTHINVEKPSPTSSFIENNLNNVNPLAVLRDLQKNGKKSEDEDKNIAKQSYAQAPTSRNRQRRFMTLEDIQCKLGYGNRVDIANALWFGKEKHEKYGSRVDQRTRSVSPRRLTMSGLKISNANQTLPKSNTKSDNIGVSVLPDDLPTCNETPSEKKPSLAQILFAKDVALSMLKRSTKTKLNITEVNVHIQSDNANGTTRPLSTSLISDKKSHVLCKYNINDQYKTNNAEPYSIEINTCKDTAIENTKDTRIKTIRAKRLRNRSITSNAEITKPPETDSTVNNHPNDNINNGSVHDITESADHKDDKEILQRESSNKIPYHEQENSTLANTTKADQNQTTAEAHFTTNKAAVNHVGALPRRVSARRRLYTGDNNAMPDPFQEENVCDIVLTNSAHLGNEFGQGTRSRDTTIHQITETTPKSVYRKDISNDRNGFINNEDMSHDDVYIEKPTEEVFDYSTLQETMTEKEDTVHSKRLTLSVNKAELPSFDEMLFNG